MGGQWTAEALQRRGNVNKAPHMVEMMVAFVSLWVYAIAQHDYTKVGLWHKQRTAEALQRRGKYAPSTCMVEMMVAFV